METSLNNIETASPDKTIGVFLREEREKRGLDYNQIFEVTRLRPSILKALENESWETLPSPVFVSGFVRSYGRALGLREEKVMALFRESEHSKISSPKPLIEPGKNIRKNLIIWMLFLLAPALVYFFWRGYSTLSEFVVKTMPTQSAEKKAVEPEKIKETPGEIEPVTLSQQPLSSDSVAEPNSEAVDTKQTDHLLKREDTANGPLVMTAIENIPSPELVLKASIREMTWLRIFVDDQDPKEYIFRPQEHFEWKAKKGFDLLIGNAGGIDLEFNGGKVENNGKAGQVVHLTLPKGYERGHP